MEWVFLNGEFIPPKMAKISVFDHGFLYGDGVYETLRTTKGKVYNLEKHLQRLRNSSKLMDIPVPLSDAQLREAIGTLVAHNNALLSPPATELRLRITLTRGQNHFIFSGAKTPTLLISSQPLMDFTKIRATGVRVTTIQIARIFPEIKSISLLPLIFAKQKAEQKGAFETLFLGSQGEVLEGSVCNIILRKGETICTAPERLVLPGTTQKKILHFFQKYFPHVSFSQEALYISDLEEADEIILTNAVFGVLPVVSGDTFEKIRAPGLLEKGAEKALWGRESEE